MHDPRAKHLWVVDRFLQYLNVTPKRGLLFKRGRSLGMDAYTDAENGGSVSGSRSTSDYCTFLCGNIVAWRSKKQSVVAQSSVEAEFKVVAQGICTDTEVATSADTNLTADIFLSYGHEDEYYSTQPRLYTLSSLK
ncbi:putative copia-type protein [Trifolium pratense]|uniref:Putative copia-type protein n=1 Tax=Trifolium pratense TaxID=57577 RepID=A0A2K3NKR6_TRIPR|nr:putative copia-type protein [Trifolium pratense]